MSTRDRWGGRRSDEDFSEEIRAHIEHEIDRLVSTGLTPDAARAAALRQFGNVTRARERFYESRRIVWLEQFWRDLVYGWRGMWRSRTFVATTVLTLAVGMSLVTVIFAIFNAYVLRPFAVRDPYSLHAIGWAAQEAGGATFRWTDYEQVRARRDLFEDVVAEASAHMSTGGRLLSIAFVSGNYFDTLGPRVLLGRALGPGDARTPGAEPVAVLTEPAWARLFDRDPSVLGREMEVNGIKLTIVGVMAPEFVGIDDASRDVWIPMTMYGDLTGNELFGSTQSRPLRMVGRLRHDVTPQQAMGSVALEPFETRLPGRIDPVRASLRSNATPVRMTTSGFAFLSPIFAAFGLVLVAACANASNVMLARANARHREIGIRLSIGASRGRVVRQLLTEGLLIATLAGGAGLVLANALLRAGVYAFVSMLPPSVAARVRLVPLDFDYRVFLFTLAVAAGVTLLFALLPALQATKLTLTDALRGQISGAIRSSTLRNLLVASQVAVSLLLLVVASTLIRNGVAIHATDLGLETAGVISIRQGRNDRLLIQRAYAELAADPRIGQVVATSRNPLFGELRKSPIFQPSGMVLAAYTFVSPEYFELLNIPIVRGRGFSQEEAAAETPVAVVSAAGAKALWPGEDPIGKTLRLHIDPPGLRTSIADTMHVLKRVADDSPDAIVVTVVGVASDVISGFVYQGKDPGHVYLPISATSARAEALMIRARSRDVTVGTVRSILLRAANEAAAYDVLALDEMVALQRVPIRAASWVGTLLSGIALALSVSGLYGVLTYTFGQRTKEIGIRMALGASARAVVRLVAVQSARLAGLGTAIGLLLAFAVMKLLSTVIRLENVSVLDPSAFAFSVALIVIAVALASYGPSRRAANIDPSAMLRSDI